MSKRVLITGGAGFVGAFVIDMLMQRTDWEIVSIDRLDFSGNLNRVNEILMKYSEQERKRFKFVYHDLKAEINPLVASFIGKPDIILHLAAGSHVDRSISHPMEFVLDNVVGTVNILEYARKLDNLETFLNFGTDEIFGPSPDGVTYHERARFNSTNPYSASKASAEEFCVAYENTYRLPMICTHCMNIFGEYQTPEKFIPLCIDRVDKGEKILIHSNKEKTKAGTRYYIYGEDVADAIFFIITKKPYVEPDYGGARVPKFNIVGKEEIDNLTLAKMIADAQNKELNYEMVDWHSSRAGHDLAYRIDGTLMRSLGWEPKIKLSVRIKQVSDWYLDNPRWLSR